MSTPVVLPNAVAAAHRAYVLANIARDRATNHPEQATLLTIADCLDTAALAFQTEPPNRINGVTITNTIPADAWLALHDAAETARNHPCAGYPADLADYVTQPVFRDELRQFEPEDLEGDPTPAKQREVALRAALNSVHSLITPVSDRALVASLFRVALTLHAELADAQH
ncbi:hypothetical protein ACIQU6_28005 [Streptomyces sp. NPDC090442]|uniref:hypothetical protein n=1 Tax=Streptomyces sp. NPDC090442 TaxID=3365962 RepID=UPI003820BAEB